MKILGREHGADLMTARLATVILLSSSLYQIANALQVGFYDTICPGAEFTVKAALERAMFSDKTIAASIIRMHFHDCFVQGCDASLLLTGSGTEQSARPNQSIRGYEVINDAKAILEGICPGVVSCADILALAARDSVELLGGPSYSAETGRFDGASPGSNVLASLPRPDFTIDQSIPFFTNLGLTQEDMVNLLGAHTVGVAQCQFFVNRLYNFSGTELPDPSLDPAYLSVLQSRCPRITGDTTNVALDEDSEFSFDTSYFTNIQNRKGVLRIDQEIADSPSTSGLVNTLAGSPSSFSSSFATSMIAMGRIGVLESGKVRAVCSTTN